MGFFLPSFTIENVFHGLLCFLDDSLLFFFFFFSFFPVYFLGFSFHFIVSVLYIYYFHFFRGLWFKEVNIYR